MLVRKFTDGGEQLVNCLSKRNSPSHVLVHCA